MSSDLVELARYPSSAEASILRSQLDAEGIRAELDGEAAASWMWHFGSAIGGVRLLVDENDLDRAAKILGTGTAIDETSDIDFGDDLHDDIHEEEELPDDLIRAWRASLIGFIFLPPFLNIYSTWIIIRNGFFIGRCRNWRVSATCVANAVVFTFFILFVLVIAYPQSPPMYFPSDGEPIEIEHETITIPLVP